MRRLALLPMLLGLVACDDLRTPLDAGLLGECLTDFPGLRIETACGASLRITVNGREIQPTTRRIDLAGAVIQPWPDWVREGEPVVAAAGGAATSFAAHPYLLCQVVTVDCSQPTLLDAGSADAQ